MRTAATALATIDALPKVHDAPRLAAMVRAFLETMRVEGASENTLQAYSHDLTAFVGFMLRNGVADFGFVSRGHARGWLKELMDSGLSRQTIRRRFAAVRSFYRLLILEEVVAINPFSELRPPREQRRLPRYMGEASVQRLLGSITGREIADLRDRALLGLIYDAGLRVSEATGLRLHDIAAGEVRVHGKGDRERVVPISPMAEKALREYVKQVRPRLLKARSDRVFFGVGRNRNPQGLNPRSVGLILRRRCERAGVPYVNVHGLRHGKATSLLDNGADINTVREFLGHVSIGTTQIYLHTSKARLRQIVEAARPSWMR